MNACPNSRKTRDALTDFVWELVDDDLASSAPQVGLGRIAGPGATWRGWGPFPLLAGRGGGGNIYINERLAGAFEHEEMDLVPLRSNHDNAADQPEARHADDE